MAKLKFPIAGQSLPWRDGPLVFEDLGTFLTGDDIEITISNNSTMVPATFQAVFNLSNYQSLSHCNITIIGDRIFLTLSENSPTKEWAAAGTVYIRIKVKNKTVDSIVQFNPHKYDVNSSAEFGGFPFYIKGKWHNDAGDYLESLFASYGMNTSVTDVVTGVNTVRALDLTGLRYLLETVTSIPFANLGLPVSIDSVGLWSKNIAIGSFKNPGHWKELLKYCQSYSAIAKTITNQQPVLSFIPASGLYADGLSIVLQMNKPGKIYYTLDGSFPTLSSQQYSAPLILSGNMVIRALGVSSDGFYSNVVRESYTVVRPSTLTFTTTGMKVTLKWTAVAGASGYNVYDATTNQRLNTTKITAVEWSEISTVPAKSYYIRVVDTQGRESLPSNVVDVSFSAEPPLNLKVTTITPTSITLEWEHPAAGGSIYDIDYDGKTKTEIGTTTTISGLTPNTEYTFVVYGGTGSVRSVTGLTAKEVTYAQVPKIQAVRK